MRKQNETNSSASTHNYVAEGLLVTLPMRPLSQIICTLKITGQKLPPLAATGGRQADLVSRAPVDCSSGNR
jgi:hypothetical protein